MRLDHLLSKEEEVEEREALFNYEGSWSTSGKMCERKLRKNFRWRCVWGTHPFPSRTRWLRLRRPMVLYWRRYGRAGGCRIPQSGGVAQLGEHLPCKQGVKGSNPSISIQMRLQSPSDMYLENCIQKKIQYLYTQKDTRHPRKNRIVCESRRYQRS